MLECGWGHERGSEGHQVERDSDWLGKWRSRSRMLEMGSFRRGML